MNQLFGNLLFRDTAIPVTEQVVNFTQARQNVLAGNIANHDTPGYKTRDLSVEDFHARLQEAIDYRDRVEQPGVSGRPGGSVPGLNKDVDSYFARSSQNPELLLHHDQTNVNMESQVNEMVKNHMEHNLALTIMNSQFRLLQSVISERA